MRCALGSLALLCLLAAGCGDSSQEAISGNTNPQTGTAGGGAAATAKPAEPATLEINPENTTITFIGTHAAPKAKDPREGTFEKFSGKAVLDVDKNAVKSLSVEIDTTSLKARLEDEGMATKLTNHLKNPDFLDVEQYPTAKFESTKIEVGEDGAHTVTGNLTLHGQTKEITFPAKVENSPFGMTLNAQFEIDRMDFGVGDSEAGKGVERPVSLKVTMGKKN